MDGTQLVKGVLDLAVLAVVAREDGYGYDIVRRLRDGGLAEVGDASVYGTLRGGGGPDALMRRGRALADARGIPIIEDAAHSLGATYHGARVGTLQRLTTLSFHPVKHITTGEGGAVLTDDPAYASRVTTD